VLIDNAELSVPDIRWALIAHLLTALVVVTLLMIAAVRIRRRRAPKLAQVP
jgi:hypothetical protein